MKPSTAAGAGIGGTSAIALAHPITTILMFELNLGGYPTNIADAYAAVIMAVLGVLLTIVGAVVGKLLAFVGSATIEPDPITNGHPPAESGGIKPQGEKE